MAKEPLFRPGDVPSAAYRNLRDAPHCKDWRAFCEALWDRFEPYADPHFLSELRIQFQQRFWEMYLTVAFLDQGFQLHKHRDGGPEFGIDIQGQRLWIDAIVPTAGAGPDAVPREFDADIAPEDQVEARLVPQEQIILRITAALAAKCAKWHRDLASGRVSESDGFIVAINDRTIRWAWLGAELPYVVKALYGIGPLEVVFNPKTMEMIESRHKYRPAIVKVSGAEVSSQAFVAGECPQASAVLYSSVDAANFPGRLGADFLVMHNHVPNVALPRGALRCAHEYWVDGEELHREERLAAP